MNKISLGALAGLLLSSCATYPVVDHSTFGSAPLLKPMKMTVAGFQSTVVFGNRDISQTIVIPDLEQAYKKFQALMTWQRFEIVGDDKIAAIPAYQNFPRPMQWAQNNLSCAGTLHPVLADAARTPQLAKELGADLLAFVTFEVSWNYGQNRDFPSGQYALVTARVKAIDSTGVTVWEDRFDTQSRLIQNIDTPITVKQVQDLAEETLLHSTLELVERFQRAVMSSG